MSHKKLFSRLSLCAITMATLLLLPLTSLAKDTIALYEKPSKTSKVIKTLDAPASLSAIYYPKDKDKAGWLKVAEPTSEGKVGWILLEEFKGTLTMHRFKQDGFFEETSFSNDSKGHRDHYYRRFHYTDYPKTYNERFERQQAEKVGRFFSHMWQRLREMQLMMDKFFNDMNDDDRSFFDSRDDRPAGYYPAKKPPASSWWDRLKGSFTGSND